MNTEIFKYAVAGGVAFLVDFSVLYACTEFLHLHYLLSNLLGYFSGLLITYALNTHWVFNYRRYRKKTWLEFLIFNVIVVASLGLNQGMMAALVGMWGMYYLSAKIVSSFFVTAFNYFAKKFILFHPTVASGKPSFE
jgi:putative flippase GtrA